MSLPVVDCFFKELEFVTQALETGLPPERVEAVRRDLFLKTQQCFGELEDAPEVAAASFEYHQGKLLERASRRVQTHPQESLFVASMRLRQETLIHVSAKLMVLLEVPSAVCGVCSDEFRLNPNTAAGCSQNHTFCRGCVAGQVRAAAGDPHCASVRCLMAGCGAHLQLSTLGWSETAAAAEAIHRREWERECFAVPGLLKRCVGCDKMGAVDPGDESNECCCGVSTCLRCDKRGHEGACAVEAAVSVRDRALAAAEAANTFTCACGYRVVRGGGCASLQCPRCSSGFCASCCTSFVIPFGQNQHSLENPHFCPQRGCPHTACGRCPLVPPSSLQEARAVAAFMNSLVDAGEEPLGAAVHEYGILGATIGQAFMAGVAAAPAGAPAAIVAAHAALALTGDVTDESDDDSDSDAEAAPDADGVDRLGSELGAASVRGRDEEAEGRSTRQRVNYDCSCSPDCECEYDEDDNCACELDEDESCMCGTCKPRE